MLQLIEDLLHGTGRDSVCKIRGKTKKPTSTHSEVSLPATHTHTNPTDMYAPSGMYICAQCVYIYIYTQAINTSLLGYTCPLL